MNDEKYHLKQDIEQKLGSYVTEIFFNENFQRYDRKSTFPVIQIGPYICKIKNDLALDVDDFRAHNNYCKFMLLVKRLIFKLKQRLSYKEIRAFITKELHEINFKIDSEEYLVKNNYTELLQQIMDVLRQIQIEQKCLPTEQTPPIEMIAGRIERMYAYTSFVHNRIITDLLINKDIKDGFDIFMSKHVLENDGDSIFFLLEQIFWKHQFHLQLFYEPISNNDEVKFLAKLKTLNQYTSSIITIYEVLSYIYTQRDIICNDKYISDILKAGLSKAEISVESLFTTFESSVMTGSANVVPYSQTLRYPSTQEPNIFSKLFDSGINKHIDKNIESLKRKYNFN